MTKFEHEALFYSKEENNKVQCYLCPHNCKILPGKSGRCNVRINQEGKLYSANYGLVLSGSKDPVEKKPLYHFLPGTCVYSYGSVGCNLSCSFCQNWHISRGTPGEFRSHAIRRAPEKAAKEAANSNCASIAYTYNEPIVWYEWILDTAPLAKEKGLKNILVTNGYITSEPLEKLLPYIDAANVDVKGDEEFYKELCKAAHHENVLQTCEMMKEKGVHLEITNLLIPGKNDSEKQLQSLINWILNDLGPDVPLHFSRYYPAYKLRVEPTPVETLKRAFKMAKEAGINYVYLGNIRSNEGSSTHCKNCGVVLIRRSGYFVQKENLSDEMKCNKCQTPADIVG
ncbi:MAG: AmmeMemoRadiSam system radical SAM enzyme [Candidatus Heimdallarchaeota archaeon]|nr:AmmeMemoRadiSam system radical SAM enzyme [Candidatus Heimdallarchaeota archaeon]